MCKSPKGTYLDDFYNTNDRKARFVYKIDIFLLKKQLVLSEHTLSLGS